MKRITIELSVDGCQRAIEELKTYQKEIKPKLDEVCKRLAQIGVEEATRVLNSIPPIYGNAVERIEALPMENGWKIVMSGEDVYFIEFGTGNGVNAHYDTSVPVAWGSWSAQHSKRLLEYGYWYYNNVKLEGTPAYMPMYYAERAIRENERRIVQEVFGK